VTNLTATLRVVVPIISTVVFIIVDVHSRLLRIGRLARFAIDRFLTFSLSGLSSTPQLDLAFSPGSTLSLLLGVDECFGLHRSSGARGLPISGFCSQPLIPRRIVSYPPCGEFLSGTLPRKLTSNRRGVADGCRCCCATRDAQYDAQSESGKHPKRVDLRTIRRCLIGRAIGYVDHDSHLSDDKDRSTA
jgi:hypothetical protein